MTLLPMPAMPRAVVPSDTARSTARSTAPEPAAQTVPLQASVSKGSTRGQSGTLTACCPAPL